MRVVGHAGVVQVWVLDVVFLPVFKDVCAVKKGVKRKTKERKENAFPCFESFCCASIRGAEGTAPLACSVYYALRL